MLNDWCDSLTANPMTEVSKMTYGNNTGLIEVHLTTLGRQKTRMLVQKMQLKGEFQIKIKIICRKSGSI
jgi:hypothetical protein